MLCGLRMLALSHAGHPLIPSFVTFYAYLPQPPIDCPFQAFLLQCSTLVYNSFLFKNQGLLHCLNFCDERHQYFDFSILRNTGTICDFPFELFSTDFSMKGYLTLPPASAPALPSLFPLSSHPFFILSLRSHPLPLHCLPLYPALTSMFFSSLFPSHI